MEKITITNPGRMDLRPIHPKVLTVEVGSYDQVSDGYHSIAELYDHRITLFIALCRIARKQYVLPMHDDTSAIHTYDIWRSKLHSDGTSLEGWFIMGIGKTKGYQISYHLPLSRWDETDFAETLPTAPEWDGHTSQDVLERLKNL